LFFSEDFANFRSMQRNSQARLLRLFKISLVAALGAVIFVNFQRTQETLKNLTIQSRIVLLGDAFRARVVPSMLIGDNRAAQIILCFEGKGTVCDRLSGEWMHLADGLFERAPFMNSNGEFCDASGLNMCSIQRTAEFRVLCTSPTTCEKVDVRSIARSRFFPGLKKEVSSTFVALETLEEARALRREVARTRPELLKNTPAKAR